MMKKLLLLAGTVCWLFLTVTSFAVEAGAGDDWSEADRILARIKAPEFPARDFSITDYGAVADGKKDCTKAIADAIAACHAAGGGRVVVPAGEFLTGAIHLLSNVNLYLSQGATLHFSTDPTAYMPVVFTRWESTECMNYSSLIYALDQENIAVTGVGTLDGGASTANWWGWTVKGPDKKTPASADISAVFDMGERGVPVEQRVFGAGHHLRPNFIQTVRCRNVLIEGITIRRSPMWEINPVLSTNIIVRKVKIDSDGPNNDGCDPECSRDILIEDCSFTTGDDCIAIKSGRNNDGRRVATPVENIIVRRCAMQDGHAGVAVGSEVTGGCRNVFVEDCSMDSPHLDRALRLKSNARRGGVIENIFMRNVQIGRVNEAIMTIDFLYEEGQKGSFPPTLRHIVVEKTTARSTPRVMWIGGFKGATIDDIRFANCNFSGAMASEVIQYASHITLDNVMIRPAGEIHSLNSRSAPSDP